ncbi:MAG: YceI family protein [Bacteroidota bacterium]
MKNVICLLISFCLTSFISAQSFELAADSAVTMTITGTSTLHGWTVTVKDVQKVPTTLSITEEDRKAIEQFGFEAVIASMDGGRGASMNTKITNALQEAKHPVITYQQNSPMVFSGIDDRGQFTGTSTGILKMVGMEKEVVIEVTGQQKNGQLILKGSKPLTFSEFDIEPPSAMFGQIVCGDDIAVNFEFRYTESADVEEE